MSYNFAEADALTGKRVTIVYNLDEPDASGNLAVEVEGIVMAAAEMGVMIRLRGMQVGEMIHADKVESIAPISGNNRDVVARILKPSTLDDVRAHLADRHGFTLSTVNSLTSLAGFTAHGGIDHENLGHKHSE